MAGKHRVLTTSSGKRDVSVTDGSVVDQGGRLDVVRGTLPGLVVDGETPRVDLAVLSDGKGVVGPGSDGHDLGQACVSMLASG